MVRAATALSTHPVAAIALGEAAGEVLEALGGVRPTLVLVTVTPPHLGTLEDVGSALHVLLEPDVVIGAVSSAVVGGGRHIDAETALVLFAVAGVPAAPLVVEARAGGNLVPCGPVEGASAAVVLADPFSCPPADLLAALGDLPVAGGLVSAARGPSGPTEREARGPSGPTEREAWGPGGSRLLIDREVRTCGAVGALLGPPARARTSQGWTPAGEPWVVTRADGDVVLEVGGRSAAERRSQALGDDPQPAALGLLQDEHVDEPGRGDLLAVPILGSAPTGGLRVAQPVPLGRVVRFLRSGPLELEADLIATLRSPEPSAPRSEGPLGPSAPRSEGPLGPSAPRSEGPLGPRPGILLFPGEGRAGDAGLVAEVLGWPVAGVGVAAPLGPVGGATALHGSGATALIVFD